MFTNFQKDRIEIHLDSNDKSQLSDLFEPFVLGTQSPEKELMIVGDIDTALDENCVLIEGTKLCTKTSILGEVELAFSKLSTNIIDDSLLVKQAGSVTLRTDETKAREKLYKLKVKHLKQALGITHTSRVGF